MKKLLKRSLKIFLVLAVMYGLYVIGYVFGAADTKGYDRAKILTTPATLSPATQDPVLKADADTLGIDVSGINISFIAIVPRGDVVGTESDDNVVGGFHEPNTIVIKSGLDKQLELSTVAYEYMHFVWAGLGTDIKTQMSANYQDLYDRSPLFQSDTESYVGDPATIADERNSTACVDMPPYLLTAEFNDWCNQFIPNRSLLFQ